MKLLPNKFPASPNKPLKSKPPSSLCGLLKAPTPKKADPLERVLRSASLMKQNSEASAVNDFILAALGAANALRADSDKWIDFCQHQRWCGRRGRPKPSVRADVADWVYRFAGPEVPIRRRGTLMQALRVLFDASYSCANAKRVLASNNIAAIAQLDHDSRVRSDIGLLRLRLNFQRAVNQPRINSCMPFLVLRLSPEHQEAVAQVLLPDSQISNCIIELAVDGLCAGKAFRAKDVAYSDNGGA